MRAFTPTRPKRSRPSWRSRSRMGRSAAACAPTAAWSARAGWGSAAFGRTATAAWSAWPMAPWSRPASIRSRRSRSSMSRPGTTRLLDRHRRLPVPLHVLPELGDRPGAAAGAGPAGPARCRRRRSSTRPTALDAGSIAYTYVEPTVFLEYALDVGAKRAEAGLRNLFITDGYATPEAVALLAPVLDAANVDLKSFDDAFYRRLCGARLAPVLDSIVAMRRAGIWLELTTLVIPGHNDDDGELRGPGALDRRDAGPGDAVAREPLLPAFRMLDVPPTPARDPAAGGRHRAARRGSPTSTWATHRSSASRTRAAPAAARRSSSGTATATRTA